MRTALFMVFIGAGLSFRGSAADPPGWDLIWKDEFDGDSLDLTKWEFEVNARGGGNRELQYYVTNNVTVRDGLLKIEARGQKYTGPEGTRDYTSSRIRTRNKGDWLYGQFEVRARMPQGQGIWPAIWFLPTDRTYGGWPHGGEIDMVEFLGHEPAKVHGTLHFSGRDGRHRHQGTNTVLEAGNFVDDFHVFRLEWDPGVFRWYVDDRLYQTQTNWTQRTGEFPAPFDQRFHLILNVAVGGNWPGSPDETTRFPQALTVDYVRVYRRADRVP